MSRKSHQDSAVRFVTAKRGPEKEPPRLGSTLCYGHELGRKSYETRQYNLLRPNVGQKKPSRLGSTICYGQDVGQKEPPRLGSTICYGQELARKSHQDSAVRFVTAKRVGPERATETRQYDLLRPNVGQKEPPRLGSTICYGQALARKSHQDSAVRFVTAKSWPERATETRQYDLLRPNVGQKEPPRLGSTICYGQTWARKSHQDSAVRFLTATSWAERITRLGSTICCSNQDSATIYYRPDLARKSHQDSAVRFVTAKRGPERATKTRQYDLLRPRVGQKEPPRLGSTICYGQELARKSQRFLTAKPERVTRLGSTICYGQELARKSHQDSVVRFVTAKSWPERATKIWQYDLLRPNVGQKEPPRLGSTICYGQMWARKSHQDSAVKFVTTKSWPERAADTRQYDLLRPRVVQKESPRLGSTILLRPRAGQKKPPRLGSTICFGQELARKSHQDSAVRFVTAKRGPERATKTRYYDLLRPRVGQKEPPRLGSTICYGHELARKSHQDSAVRFVTAKSWPEKATKTRQYDLLRPRVGQKKPPRLGSTICYGQTCARKSHQDSAIRFVTAKCGPERATKTVRFVTAKSWQERAAETRQ